MLVPVHWLLAGKSCILINEDKDKLVFFLARNTMFYLPHTPLILPFWFYSLFLIFIHDHIYRTSTPHRPYMDPTLTLPPPFFSTTTFLLFSTTTTTFLLFSLHHHHRRHHISIVFPPPPPPPPPNVSEPELAQSQQQEIGLAELRYVSVILSHRQVWLHSSDTMN